MRTIFRDNPEVTRKLRAFWALHAVGDLEERTLVKSLDDSSEYLRWWAIQFLGEEKRVSVHVLEKFASMAESDPSPMVRLGLASVLQRLPLNDRWAIAGALLNHATDAFDQNLPLMIWYGIEPLVPLNRAQAVQLMARCKIPLVRQFISQRLAVSGS